MPSGAYVKLNGDGSGTIVTGAQECGTGSVMALPLLAAEVLGMRPEHFTIVYQDTDAGPWDAGASGSQTTFNNGRAVVEAAIDVRDQLLELAEEELEAARADLELVDGRVRVKGSPATGVDITELAEKAAGDKLLLGRGSGSPPAMPDCDASGCIGRLGMESFLAPTFITHAVRCKVDRATGVVRVLEVAAAHDSGTVINRMGADGQVEGGVVMGIGMALSEGTQLSADGRQRNPHLLDYKLQTASDVPSIQVDWVGAPDPNGRPERREGGRRAAVRADAGRGRERDREGGRAGAQPADDAGARVGGDAAMSATYTAAATLAEALAALAGGARPVAGGTDLVVGARQGKAPLPGALVAIHGLAELRGIAEAAGGGLRIGALASHADLVAHPVVRAAYTALADASAIVGSHATRHIGTIGGNVMNASPAMETGGPLICLGAEAILASEAGERRVAVESLLTGPGRTVARPDELLVAIELPAPPPGTGSCYVRLEYRRQMEIAVVGATCVVTLDGARIATARIAITALTPRIVRVPEAEAALAGSDGGADAVHAAGAAAAAAAEPDLRRARLGRLPPGDGRGDRPAGGRRRGRPRPRVERLGAHPRQPGAARRRS